MTELAYLADMPAAYVRSFRARVVALPPGAVVLDRTFFYPAGGGQPGDRGTLGLPGGPRLVVVDVAKSGPSVLHRWRGPSGAVRQLAGGVEVEGEIDWPRRHRHMRLHTAQHLTSALVFLRTRLRTRKAHLAGHGATIDLEGPFSAEEMEPLAQEVAAAIRTPRAVAIRQVPRSEWDANPTSARSGLVPLPPQVDPVRVIEIDGVDVCPCGGTHVRSTGEIGRLEFAPPAGLPDGGARLAFKLVEPDPPTPTA